MQRQPQTLRCVPRSLVSLPNVCFQGFWSTVEPNCCIFQGSRCGTKPAIFSRGFGLLWNQNCCIFKGFGSKTTVFQDFGPHGARTIIFQGLGPHSAKTTVFSRDFKSSWCQNYCILQGCDHHRTKATVFSQDFGPQNKDWGNLAWATGLEAQLQDQGAHACVIFFFNSSLQNKSA